jgi:glyoxylase-like metal-dependent hydrolase (beta-lactamase superfamily II)
MLVKTIPVGHLETNCYIVTNENTLECVVIDPGDESNAILDYLEDNRLKCTAILITHGHYDHTGAADTVAE